MMEYLVKPKYCHEQSVYFNDSGEIKEAKVIEVMAKIFADGRIVCFYMLDVGKTHYKKVVPILKEEHHLFDSPDEVAADIVKRYEKSKEKSEEQKKS